MAREVIFSEGDFTFVKESGIGRDNTPWDGLDIITTGNAEKHIIDIRLNTYRSPMFGQTDDDGNIIPVHYTYVDTEVSHGMRMRKDTLEETEEYIVALQEAVKFARRVNSWLIANPEWYK